MSSPTFSASAVVSHPDGAGTAGGFSSLGLLAREWRQGTGREPSRSRSPSAVRPEFNELDVRNWPSGPAMRRSRPNILRLRTLARGRVREPLLFYPNNTNTKVIGPFRNWVENPAPAPIVLSQEDDRQRPGGLIEMGRERAFDGMQTVDRHYPWLATVASSGNFSTA